MDKYTYTDVIINPEDPRVEIGAEYYCALGAQACIDYANRDVKERTLDDIDTSGNYSPFIADGKDYPFIIRKKESSYAERQEKWIAANDLKVGDLVRVIREAEDNEDGWDCYWAPRMTALVGSVLKVKKIDEESGIVLPTENGDLFFPYFVLEKVEQKYVPFDLSKEEDRVKLRGAWVRPKDCYPNVDHLIRGISNITVWFGDSYLNAQELLNEYEFIDGSPCGKIVEG